MDKNKCFYYNDYSDFCRKHNCDCDIDNCYSYTTKFNILVVGPVIALFICLLANPILFVIVLFLMFLLYNFYKNTLKNEDF